MKNLLCPLCKNQNTKKCFSVRNYDVIACNFCELFFINPYPMADNLPNRLITYNYKELKVLEPKRHYYDEIQFYNKYYSLIASECKKATTILDIGCGTGHLLERLKEYPNILRVGIEPNKERAKIASKVSGCEICQIPIEKFSSKTKFDVITMINVLSHIPNFDDLFNSIQSLLRKNGKLILKVGEVRKDVKKRAVFDWGIPDHLHFLGLNTIYFICRKYKFKIIKHHRILFSSEFFSPHRWKTIGRSTIRNIIKQIIVHTPFALPILAKFYDLLYGKRIYSSFIVLSPQ